MKAKLVHENDHQRFYKLNQKIKFDIRGNDIIKRWDLICISDATSFPERLVFLGIETNGEFEIYNFREIGGIITTFGVGDEDTIYPDDYYLKQLAEANNLEFEGIIK